MLGRYKQNHEKLGKDRESQKMLKLVRFIFSGKCDVKGTKIQRTLIEVELVCPPQNKTAHREQENNCSAVSEFREFGLQISRPVVFGNKERRKEKDQELALASNNAKKTRRPWHRSPSPCIRALQNRPKQHSSSHTWVPCSERCHLSTNTPFCKEYWRCLCKFSACLEIEAMAATSLGIILSH